MKDLSKINYGSSLGLLENNIYEKALSGMYPHQSGVG